MENSYIKPSYHSNFARSAGESVLPGLWNGLMGLWVPFLGITGNILRDVGSFRNHGSVINATWKLGDNGHVLDFDANDNRVAISHTLKFNIVSDLTIIARIYPRTFGIQAGNNGRVINKGGDIWGIYVTSGGGGDMRLKASGVTGADFISNSGVLSLNAWQNIAITRKRNTGVIKYYVNGVDVGGESPGGTEPMNTDGNDLLIGNRPGFDRAFDGLIPKIAVWRRVLSHLEIRQDNSNPYGMLQKTINPTLVIPPFIGSPWYYYDQQRSLQCGLT